jgi:hypothetical protein
MSEDERGKLDQHLSGSIQATGKEEELTRSTVRQLSVDSSSSIRPNVIAVRLSTGLAQQRTSVVQKRPDDQRLSRRHLRPDTSERVVHQTLADALVGRRRERRARVEVGALTWAGRSGGVGDGRLGRGRWESDIGEGGSEVGEVLRGSDGSVVGGEGDHAVVVGGREIREGDSSRPGVGSRGGVEGRNLGPGSRGDGVATVLGEL